MIIMLFSLEISIIVLILLIFLSAFFSSVETALVSLDRIALKRMVKNRVKNARLVQKLKEHPNRMLTTILIGNNLVNILASIIAADVALTMTQKLNWPEATAIVVATAGMTFLILTFGEITPKGIATRKNERLSLIAAKPILVLSKIFFPIIWLLRATTKPMIDFFGGPKKKDTLTLEEFKTMVAIGREEGTIDEIEHEIITKATKLDEIPLEEVMTPLNRVTVIPQEAKLSELLKLIEGKPFSRIPVFKEIPENIVGVLYLKDIIPYLKEKEQISRISVKDVMMPALFIPFTTKSDVLLKELQYRKRHISMIVNSKGRVIGIVTMEDLLEELVGEIFDESERGMNINVINEKTVQASGSVNLKEINKVLKTSIPSNGFKTIGGFIFVKLDRFPKEKEELEFEGVKIKIEEISGCKIVKMRIEKK